MLSRFRPLPKRQTSVPVSIQRNPACYWSNSNEFTEPWIPRTTSNVRPLRTTKAEQDTEQLGELLPGRRGSFFRSPFPPPDHIPVVQPRCVDLHDCDLFPQELEIILKAL